MSPEKYFGKLQNRIGTYNERKISVQKHKIIQKYLTKNCIKSNYTNAVIVARMVLTC